METNNNLDSRINEYSYDMINNNRDKKDVINLIDKALGVLSNDGVYGYYVYCKSKKNNDISKAFIEDIVEKFKNDIDIDYKNGCDEFFIKLSENLNSLLFFKDIIERILIYARYHAKALGDNNG
ncbi:hypothetical protein [Clostridium sp. HV4-5-A1G]|uniref:hypothetical protein n=1 Tax=Clostridium sp. HV4-5-A1G TaxID=2004595 RepID=UPI001687F63A|nr:hypothetical protein [Clostridium sp. HV4-5-A1G]